MGNALKILPHYTYDDYVNWEGRWEVLHGIPYAMAPLPTPGHQLISSNLLRLLGNALLECKTCKVYQPVDYKVADDIIVQPDLLVICAPVKKKFLDFPPELVVEVLSPSTALKDRHAKYSIYEKQRIPYYIIISPDKENVEIFSLVSDEYKLIKEGRDISFSFSFSKNCVAEINFSDVWE
jgi:Uma2 family endonuclease